MSRLPEDVSRAWDDKKGPVVFATVDNNGVPNIIYATCVSKYNEETLMIADNYFDKTRKNILLGCKGSVLFITNEDKAYQVKGAIEYHDEGTMYEDMKKWNPAKHPGNAAAVLKVEEVYSGSAKLL